MVEFEDGLLRALLSGEPVTKEMALSIPSIAGAIDMIGSIVASTPIKLYRESNGETEEVPDDPRVRLLNDETGDTLTPNEFWRAMVQDYYLGKGGYAYIDKPYADYESIRYVKEECISYLQNADPIFKEYKILVQGRQYSPWNFIRILRNTRDGIRGVPITEESAKLVEVAYETLRFQLALLRRGGAKKGFLKSEKKVTQEVLDALKLGFRNLYSNSSENTVVLNNGIDFKEASATSVEMQLKENKDSDADDISKLFHIPPEVLMGQADEKAASAMAKMAAVPLMAVIQSSLNRDFLRENEKGTYYWAFDTKELLKGSMKERYEAYKLAIDANFMQIDEVRYAEDMKPLGLTWIRLGLQDVLYDPATNTVYTPNTGQTATLREGALSSSEGGEEGE